MPTTLPRKHCDPAAAGPLDGVRVVDLSRLVAGNIVTHVLADFGADVIKVERPGTGDDLRNWRVEGHEVFWKIYSRNKRAIALDIEERRRKAHAGAAGPGRARAGREFRARHAGENGARDRMRCWP